MSTFYGVNATKRNAVPPQKVEAKDGYGKLRVLFDVFNLTADLASGNTIGMMKIPKGARVIDAILYADDIDGSGGTLDVGWLASADGAETAQASGLFSDVDVTSASKTQLAAGSLALLKEFAGEVQVEVKVDGDTDAITGKIALAVIISME